MNGKKNELREEWRCWYCKGDLGLYPRGIRVICPICKRENILPGHNTMSKKRWKEFEEINKRAKKYALEKYRAMRER